MTASLASQSLLMVRPITFGFNEQTAQSNTFQHKPQLQKEELRQRALQEFDAAVETLRSHGITIAVFEDKPEPEKPDAIFPNNWLSTWPDGTVYLYPMATACRRIERSEAALDLLRMKWQINEIVDLSPTENEEKYLESTGVMIFDHPNKTVYGCLSVRCDEKLFNEHAKQLGYQPITFHAVNHEVVPIYHTNVLMSVQSTTAVICLGTIKNTREREIVVTDLQQTNHEIIDITEAQMNAFCGNVLEVQNAHGEHFIVMSQTAFANFTPEQKIILAKNATLLPIAIPTIETIGGGSARCMLAEIFLPAR